ncbi:MAG: aminopeptidase P family N-terminal domain-containing protein [Nocardioidaceae bacterium]
MRQEQPNRAITDHALARTQAELRRHDLPAALLFDAYNIRYVTGTSVMPVWSLHAMDRFALVPAEGDPLLWEYASVQPDASTTSATTSAGPAAGRSSTVASAAAIAPRTSRQR